MCDIVGRGDVTFTMDDDNWIKLMTGNITPQQVRERLHYIIVIYQSVSVSVRSVFICQLVSLLEM